MLYPLPLKLRLGILNAGMTRNLPLILDQKYSILVRNDPISSNRFDDFGALRGIPPGSNAYDAC